MSSSGEGSSELILPGLSTGDWWQSPTNHNSPAKWLGQFGYLFLVEVTLANYRSLLSVIGYSLSPSVLSRPRTLRSLLPGFRQDGAVKSLPCEASWGVLTSVSIRLAWQPEEELPLSSASPVALLAAGKLQLGLVFSPPVLSDMYVFLREASVTLLSCGRVSREFKC